MAVATIHGLYGVRFGSAGTTLGGITQQSIGVGSSVRTETSSGSVYGQFSSLTAQNPTVDFTTLALAAAIAQIPIDNAALGKSIASLAGGLDLFGQLHADGGSRASGAAHRQYNIRKGIVVPRTLSCQHQGDASLQCQVVVAYDGTNQPIVITDAVALPGTLVDLQRYSLGKITIGGIVFSHVRSIEIDFGLSVVAEGSDSDIWPTFVSIRTMLPKITLRGISIAWFKSTAIPLLGLPFTHADTAIYFRKKAQGGTFVADASAEHVMFTAAGIATVDRALDVSGDDIGEVTVMLDCRKDGTDIPIIAAVSQAIP